MILNYGQQVSTDCSGRVISSARGVGEVTRRFFNLLKGLTPHHLVVCHTPRAHPRERASKKRYSAS
jgi:hypothetical protein